MDARHGSYQHIGDDLILLDGDRYVRLDSHDAERMSFGEFWRNKKFASLDDHHMANYIRRIKRKLSNARQILFAEWNRLKKSGDGI